MHSAWPDVVNLGSGQVIPVILHLLQGAIRGTDIAMNPMPMVSARTPFLFFGKYRGNVVDNADPFGIGRVIAEVPDVPGTGLWAMPCVPSAGFQSGVFVVPPIGSSVWVEYEKGDPAYPIWTGGYWTLAAAMPVLATAPPPVPPGQNIVIQTTGGNMLALGDSQPTPTSGGIVLKASGGAAIVINSTGITISNGQGASISLVGPVVSINGQPQ